MTLRLLHLTKSGDCTVISEKDAGGADARYCDGEYMGGANDLTVAWVPGDPLAMTAAAEIVRAVNVSRLMETARHHGGTFGAFVTNGLVDGWLTPAELDEGVAEGWFDFFADTRDGLAAKARWIVSQYETVRNREPATVAYFMVTATDAVGTPMKGDC